MYLLDNNYSQQGSDEKSGKKFFFFFNKSTDFTYFSQLFMNKFFLIVFLLIIKIIFQKSQATFKVMEIHLSKSEGTL